MFLSRREACRRLTLDDWPKKSNGLLATPSDSLLLLQSTIRALNPFSELDYRLYAR